MKVPKKLKTLELAYIKNEAIVQYATMGILIVNDRGSIVQVNPYAEKLFQYMDNELLGKNVETLIPRRYAKQHIHHRENYNENPQARIMGEQLDLFGTRKDGTEFPVDISLSPYQTSEGKFVIAFIADLTLRKEEEFIISEKTKELQHINKELGKLNKDLVALVYVSSHDLQEPLRKIKNYISILLKDEKDKLSKDGKIYLQKTYTTAIKMQKIIDDLLEFFRTKNSGRMFEKVDLNAILADVITDFEDVINEKKAIIKIDRLCEANVIPFQFQQLMHNLISNALNFSHAKRAPHISIKTEVKPGSKLKNKQLSPDITYCHFTISDNGIGFDPQYKDRIFEIFQRLNEYNTYKGSGIGLAICKQIVENHKGIITATGKVNKGARFDIYIPTE